MASKKTSKEKSKTELPFTLVEGPQGFKLLNYTVGLATDKPGVKLKILIPFFVRVEKDGDSLGMVDLGTLKVNQLRKLARDKLQVIRSRTMSFPPVLEIPLNKNFTVKGEKFELMLKAVKES